MEVRVAVERRAGEESKEMKGLIFVDVEADGKAPGVGQMTEFGAVNYDLWKVNRDPDYCAFHGVLWYAAPDPENPACSRIIVTSDQLTDEARQGVMRSFEVWLKQFLRITFISDNPAYDFQWINHAFWSRGMPNPFGHSGRSIKDFYAGLSGNFLDSQGWKRLRITPHDHNPVHDSLGNCEAFDRILRGER